MLEILINDESTIKKIRVINGFFKRAINFSCVKSY